MPDISKAGSSSTPGFKHPERKIYGISRCRPVPGELPIKLRLEAPLTLGSGVANDNR